MYKNNEYFLNSIAAGMASLTRTSRGFGAPIPELHQCTDDAKGGARVEDPGGPSLGRR